MMLPPTPTPWAKSSGWTMVEGAPLQYWVDIVEPAAPAAPWWWYPILVLAVLLLLGLLGWLLRRWRWYWYLMARRRLRQAVTEGEVSNYLAWLERGLRRRPLTAATRQQLLQYRYAARPPATAALATLLLACRREWRQ